MLKRFKISICFLFFIFCVKAQTNLVPNPSFEDTVQCPINGFITNSQGWKPYSSSPDYYNSCVDESFYGYSVPNNFAGTQSAASGQAYCGALCYIEGETDYSLNREISGRDLISPLVIGQKYFVSFKTVAIPYTVDVGSSININKLGVLFSAVSYTNTNSSTIPPIQNFAHVYTDSIITDTTNWTTIFGSFIADSSYGYISIGNFFENDNTDTVHTTTSPFPTAYYLFDDVCVSTDSSFCANFAYTGIKDEQINSNISVYPNPVFHFLNITFEDNKAHAVVIYNSIGETILNQSIIQQGRIDISALSQGMYYIQTSVNNTSISKKLIFNP